MTEYQRVDPAALLASSRPPSAGPPPSSEDLARFIGQLGEAAKGGPTLRQGTVTAVRAYGALPTVDVSLSGSIVPGARYMNGYVPLVGDTVWVLRNGPDVLVLGDLQVEGNAVKLETGTLTGGSWYRIAETVGGDPTGADGSTFGAPRAHGRFALADMAGRHARVEFGAGISFNSAVTAGANAYVSTLFSTSYNGQIFSKARLIFKGTYNKSYLEVFVPTTVTLGAGAGVAISLLDNDWPDGWRLNQFTAGSVPAGYSTREWLFADEGDSWTPITLLNGWANYNLASYDAAAYRYGTSGLVELRGLIKHATTTTVGVVGNFPVGLRTLKDKVYSVLAGAGGNARMDIRASGDLQVISYMGGSGAYISLEGLVFRPDK